jgi:hypothetical protein
LIFKIVNKLDFIRSFSKQYLYSSMTRWTKPGSIFGMFIFPMVPMERFITNLLAIRTSLILWIRSFTKTIYSSFTNLPVDNMITFVNTGINFISLFMFFVIFLTIGYHFVTVFYVVFLMFFFLFRCRIENFLPCEYFFSVFKIPFLTVIRVFKPIFNIISPSFFFIREDKNAMGKAARLHRQAVIEGKAAPYRGNVWNTCKLCGDLVPNNKARDHIRSCWQYPISESTPLPEEPIVYRGGKLMPNWKDFITAKVAAK